jgi:hypothetical protein
MQSYRRIPTAIATAFATIAFVGGIAAADAQSVGITINGSEVNVAPAPIIDAGRVFVPLRGVFQDLGASVVYDNGQINATGNGTQISLQIGSTQATVDGAPQTIDVAPFIVGESTYVPLRFVSQALGASVSWDEADQIVAITTNGSTDVNANDDEGDDYADVAPPPLPDYDAPPVPEPNDIWIPGYWALAAAGFYWVPGTWVAPPQPGYWWTPGYWAYANHRYAFHNGYWARQVGYYGGINYGAGYYGHGYVGGRWQGNTFQYNTAVVRVSNPTIIRNVYVNRTVIVNRVVNRISYNGGPHGIAAAPTATERAVIAAPHLAITAAQRQHVQVASRDRELLHAVNAGHPPVAAVARPLAPNRKPVSYVPFTATRPIGTIPHAAAPAAAPRPEAARPAYLRPQAAPAPVRPAEPAYARPEAARPAPARPAQPAYVRPQAAPAQPAPPRARPAAVPQYTHPAAAPKYAHPAAAPQYARPAAAPQAARPPVAHPAPQRAEPQRAAPQAAPANESKRRPDDAGGPR